VPDKSTHEKSYKDDFIRVHTVRLYLYCVVSGAVNLWRWAVTISVNF
jgi:hypothetical protein